MNTRADNKPLYIEFRNACLPERQGKRLSLESPLVMGIVNITPDSFYDGGKYNTIESAIKHAEQLIADGADIIDLGAASTRPGAVDIGKEEELKKLLPVLEYLAKNYKDVIFSVDTYHSGVAKEVVMKGASMINDISGGTFDSKMFKTIAESGVPYVLMHIQGTPETMQTKPEYNNVVQEVFDYFTDRIKLLKKEDVKQIIIDPGFGFGKTTEHNYTLLTHLHKFQSFSLPVMAGLSRKSMINKVLKIKPEDALAGTVCLNTIALLKGANILRVHDVKEAKQVAALVQQLRITN